LIREKTVLEATSALGTVLCLKLDFEFENTARKELGALASSKESRPNLIMFFSSAGTDFLTGEGWFRIRAKETFFRTFLPRNHQPRGFLLTLPFLKLTHPVFFPISPHMEVNVKVWHSNMLDISNSKAHSLGPTKKQ
jgi:hypothetical protein